MKNVWIWIVVLVVVVGGGYWYWQSQQAPAMQMQMSDDGTSAATDAVDDSTAASSTPAAGSSAAMTGVMTATVTYDGKTFSPSTVTIMKGGTVTFTDTSGQMWVASNPHPVHTGYDGTSRSQHCAPGYTGAAPFDQCSSGTSFSFVFNKTGSWGYHDHLNAGAGGTVIVQ